MQSLKGNEDRNSEVKHILNEGVLARYLQFLPDIYHGGVCLRTEVFGVKQKPGDYFLLVLLETCITLMNVRLSQGYPVPSE